jgi:hypothetical protein
MIWQAPSSAAAPATIIARRVMMVALIALFRIPCLVCEPGLFRRCRWFMSRG